MFRFLGTKAAAATARVRSVRSFPANIYSRGGMVDVGSRDTKYVQPMLATFPLIGVFDANSTKEPGDRIVTKMALTQVSSAKCFEGYQKVYEHERNQKFDKLNQFNAVEQINHGLSFPSTIQPGGANDGCYIITLNLKYLGFSSELKCKMRFGIYLPPKAERMKCPVLYWLSGLTCTEQNFITKAASQQAGAEHGIVIVAPDTSPRGCNIQGEDDSWDFGTGAGFYINATEEPWKTNYRMYTYITEELPRLINANFSVDPEKMSIFGHSMGGHGALICALRNPGKYKSLSALAPICNPVQCPWGQKAFTGYLGSDKSKWEEYDATCLARTYSGPLLDILIDQGKDDQFLAAGQLLPDNFITVCTDKKIPVVFRLHEGYDHSYYFIATFVGDHIKHHAKYLNA